MLTHEQHLLVNHVRTTWAHSHAKSTLAMLAVMLLQQRPRWAGELRDELCDISGGVFDVDMQTLHRMLRRLDRLGLVHCAEFTSTGPGAARKVYEATEVGVAVLKAHLKHTLAYLQSPTFSDAHKTLCTLPGPMCECRSDCADHGSAQ